MRGGKEGGRDGEREERREGVGSTVVHEEQILWEQCLL